MMRHILTAAVAASVLGTASVVCAAEIDICSNTRLTASDRSACSDRMRAAATDHERNRVVAEFSQRLKPGGTPDSGAIGARSSVNGQSNAGARAKVPKAQGSSAGALSGLPLPGSSGQPLLRPNPGVGATGGVRTTGGGALPQ